MRSNIKLTGDRSQVFEFDRSRIEVLIHGQGPLIIFLPSLGRGVEDFLPFSSLMVSQGFKVCLPFPRGIGKSEGLLAGISLNDLADDVANVISVLGQPAIVAGHAFGNWVARNLATRYPALVRALVLLAAAHRNFPPHLRDQIDLCMDADVDSSIRLQALQLAFFANKNLANDWLTGWHPNVAKAQRTASKACPSSEWWHAGAAPILDIQADLDPFAPLATAFELQNELGSQRVSVVRIPNASHALIPEQPIAVSQALIEFIHKIP
jgi:pimeloyl-ACP methyl ester carboxylesterase